LKHEDGIVDPYLCATDADCVGGDACQIKQCRDGFCALVRTLTCDDGDPCTADTCNPTDGTCSNVWRTSDDDRDGHYAPLPGTVAGQPDACGDDCNDTSALAYPGAREACDGVDNDCNGSVDDHYQYQSMDELPKATLVSFSSANEAIPAGLAWDGQKFAMTVVERNKHWQSIFHAYDAKGQLVIEPTLLTKTASDALAGPLVWTGSVFGTVWEDRRIDSYDIYFNRLDVFGQKLAADLRVSNTSGFSIEPSLLYDAGEWLVTYADQNDRSDFAIFLQRISKEATPVGSPLQIVPPAYNAHQARLSRNSQGYGLFFRSVSQQAFMYVPLDAGLNPAHSPVALSIEESGDVSVRWNGDRYIVVWDKRSETSVGPSIWATTIDAFGNVIDSPRAITTGARIARGPTIVSMGDRFVLLWADDRFTPDLFQLSLQMFDNQLQPMGLQEQVTNSPNASVDPIASLGGGALGVMFRSFSGGPWETYFLSIGCWYPEP
jgi:hypothetical protein